MIMNLEMFLNFDGNCKEAIEFYAKVFRIEIGNVMTYADTPPSEGYEVPEADKDKIMYAGLPFNNMVLMCMDVPGDYPFILGNNISPTINLETKDEVKRVFEELSADGTILMEPKKTFFSELYASVIDKFGINWQILYFVKDD
jgi:PhnB protein